MHYVGYKGLITWRTCREYILQPIWLIKASRWFSDDDDDVQGITPLSIFSKDLIHNFIVYPMTYWSFSDVYSNDVIQIFSSWACLFFMTCWAICAHSLLNISVKDETTESSGKDKGKAKMNWHTAFYVKVLIYFRNWCLVKRSVLYAKTLDVCLY